MKTIKGIDDKPTHFEENLPAGVIESIPTFRKMFRNAVAQGMAKSGDDALDLYQVGMKLRVDGADVSLEDAEFKMLKDRCASNVCQWQAHFHGQVMLKLKDAEEAK